MNSILFGSVLLPYLTIIFQDKTFAHNINKTKVTSHTACALISRFMKLFRTVAMSFMIRCRDVTELETNDSFAEHPELIVNNQSWRVIARRFWDFFAIIFLVMRTFGKRK
ncbi:hypothetical protein CDAR_505411 [Caerostris darwini]|uniref:Uncharacterized protein n=1 Tax=Caerostris darwini TaxID=1538125 RepID=A0AAV4UNY4_9ARAC|nr:hypothetical protein CDAR_505411 [Caerostris darwini]